MVEGVLFVVHLCPERSRAFKRPATTKDRQPGEKALRRGRKQVVAPCQSGLECLVTVFDGSLLADEEAETSFKLRKHLRGCKCRYTRGSKLDSEGDPLEFFADGCYSCRV